MKSPFIIAEGFAMCEEPLPAFEQAFGTLRQFTRARRSTSRAMEHCELCSAGLSQEHPHLVELASRQILCACDACAMLFDGMEKIEVQARLRGALKYLLDFEMTDGQWESLLIPINMAFFFHSSIEGKMIALYPSPAGAVESLLPLEAWNEIADEQSSAEPSPARHRSIAGQPGGPCPWAHAAPNTISRPSMSATSLSA